MTTSASRFSPSVRPAPGPRPRTITAPWPSPLAFRPASDSDLQILVFSVFTWHFLAVSEDHGGFQPLPAVGPDCSNVMGVAIFNFCLSLTIPSWMNEKKSTVGVNGVVWGGRAREEGGKRPASGAARGPRKGPGRLFAACACCSDAAASTLFRRLPSCSRHLYCDGHARRLHHEVPAG